MPRGGVGSRGRWDSGAVPTEQNLPNAGRHRFPQGGSVQMNVLLVIAILLILLSLLGFGGVWSALRSAAWLILVIGIVILVLSFLF